MDGSRSFLSVVIVTQGRPALLERCLSSLLRTGEGLAIHVEINGPDAAAREVCERLAPGTAGMLRFRERESAVLPGEARNSALGALGPSEWVLFIDDDAYVDAEYFRELRAILTRWPDACVIGGPNLTPPGSSLFQRASGVALASRLATFFSSARYRARGEERAASEEDLILCNLFVRRDALGGRPFPEGFLCGEENWFLHGLSERGQPMAYSPRLHVWHERRARVEELARQVLRYGEGRARNLVARPRGLRLPHLVPTLCLAYALVAAVLAVLGAGPESTLAQLLAFAPFAIYPGLCLAAGWVSARRAGEGPRVALAAAGVFGLVHAAYGIGMLAGLARPGRQPRGERGAASREPARGVLAAAFAGVCAAALWIYWPLVQADPILERDDLRTLHSLRGWAEFRQLALAGHLDKLVIYQPLRDASLLLDRKLGAVLGFGTYHLTNWLLWCAIVGVAYALLRLLVARERAWLAFGGAAIFAVHPIATASVGWISARKHLLATLFALAATATVVRYRERGGRWAVAAALSALFYGLSVLSHPIAILWPLWVLYYARLQPEAGSTGEPNPAKPRPPGVWALGALLLPFTAVGLFWSVRYYGGQYVAHTLNLKFSASPDAGAPISLLAHGRYLLNLLVPLRLGAVYYPGSTWNLAGLFLAPFVFAALLTGPRGREARAWLAFYFFALLPVTLAMTNVFVSDTYALLPAFGLTALFVRYIDGYWREREAHAARRDAAMPALAALGALVLFTGFAGLARAQAESWLSDRALWTRTDAVESSPRSLAMRTQLALEAGDPVLARELLVHLYEWDPDNAAYPRLFARAVHLDPRLRENERVDLLSRVDQPGSAAQADPWFNYFYGATLAQAGDFRAADERYRKALNAPESFEDELAKAAAEALEICRLAGAKDCDARAIELRQRIAASGVLTSHWDEAMFRARAQELDRTLAGGRAWN